MATLYEVLFYNGWQDAPAYYLIGGIEGPSPKAALRKNLESVVQEVRAEFSLGDEVEKDDICRSLYAMRSDALVPAWKVIGERPVP